MFNKFTKSELISLIVIFAVLLSVSIPNYIVSLRRARDQTRRDDIGSLEGALSSYMDGVKMFPLSTADGKIVACKKSGENPVQTKDGKWKVDLIPCDWAKDPLKDPFGDNTYLSILPRDPDYQKGAAYLYFSDGNRYQIFAAMEGMDESEIDLKIIDRNLKCGTRICNVGRSYKVPLYMSIEDYDKTLEENK